MSDTIANYQYPLYPSIYLSLVISLVFNGIIDTRLCIYYRGLLQVRYNCKLSISFLSKYLSLLSHIISIQWYH